MRCFIHRFFLSVDFRSTFALFYAPVSHQSSNKTIMAARHCGSSQPMLKASAEVVLEGKIFDHCQSNRCYAIELKIGDSDYARPPTNPAKFGEIRISGGGPARRWNKGYSRVGLLFNGFASRSPRVLRQAYVTFVRPVLEYASSVWSPHLKKLINAIERVQKHFSKRIKSLSHLCYTERLLALDIEPLELRRLKSDLVLYYKMFNNLIAFLALNILATLN